MKKRIISVLLALVMLIVMFPVMGMPAEASENLYYDEFGVTYEQLFTQYPEYLHSEAEEKITDIIINQYSRVLSTYGGKYDFIPSYTTSLDNGFGLAFSLNEILAGLGLSKSMEEQWLYDSMNLLMNNINTNQSALSSTLTTAGFHWDLIDNVAIGKEPLVDFLENKHPYLTRRTVRDIVDEFYKKGDSILEGIGEAITLSQIIVSVFELHTLQRSNIVTIMESIPANSSMGHALELLLDDIEKPYTQYIVDQYGSQKAVELIYEAIMKATFSYVYLGAELAAWFATDVLYQGATASDIGQTTILSGFVTTLYSAVASQRITIQRNATADTLSSADIQKYQFLYSAYIEAIRTTLESAYTIAKSESDRHYVSTALSLCDSLTYDKYIELCMSELKADIDAGIVEKPRLENNMEVTGLGVPSTLFVGSRFWLKGTITSKYSTILSVSFDVYDSNGTWTTGGTAQVNGNSYVLDGSDIDNKTEFNLLKPGTYTCKLVVYADNGLSCTEEELHVSTLTVTESSNNTNHDFNISNKKLANMLDTIVDGDIDIYSDSAFKNEVCMPVETYMSNDTQYWIKSKTTGNPASGWQCFIYANAVYNKLFNEWVGNGTSLSHSIIVVPGGSNTASFELFATADVRCGAYMRSTTNSNGSFNGNYGHSLIILSYDANSITYLEGNADGYGKISLTTKSWSNFNRDVLSGRGRYICHVIQPTAVYYDSLYPIEKECSHNYSYVDDEPFCTETGYRTYTCSNCGDSYTETIPATGHDYSSEKIEATCTSPEIVRFTCGNCGDTYEKYPDDAYTQWSEQKPNDVDENMVDTKTQYRYKTRETATSSSETMEGWNLYDTTTGWGEYGPWNEWSDSSVSGSDSIKVEKRTLWGYYYFLCPNCGSHMHAYGTCFTWAGGCGAKTTVDGWRQIWHTTSWDNAQLKDWHGTGHYYTTLDGQRYFKWTDGGSKTQYRYCTREQETVHHFERWTDWSNWEDTVYENDENRIVESRTMYRVLKAEFADHQYDSIVKEPTCTEQGYTTHTCVHCGDSYVDNWTERTGHVYENGICTACGEAEATYSRGDIDRDGDVDVDDVLALLWHVLFPNDYPI